MESNNPKDSLGNYYAFHKASAILSHNKDKEIGKVIAEYKDRLIVLDGEIKREHVYLIPKIRIDFYGNKQVYFNIPENLVKEFEF